MIFFKRKNSIWLYVKTDFLIFGTYKWAIFKIVGGYLEQTGNVIIHPAESVTGNRDRKFVRSRYVGINI